ncbi:MAG TPA: dihydropteroate synthase [Thermoanaerobaculia bacterium]
MKVSADLVIPAAGAAELLEIASWDGFRPATFAASEFPVDVVRLEGSASPPVVLSRARRAESLKALPATLRGRAQETFERAGRRIAKLALAHGGILDLGEPPAVMGIVNVTPDSFSDGGIYFETARAAERALEMFEEGAAVVDIGGESTRPANYGEAAEIPADEEIRRVVPVIEAVRRKSSRPLSIDTRKAAVARAAIAAGANLVNDVSAFRYDPEMAGAVGEARGGAILMHMKGTDPRTMQRDVSYAHPLADVASELAAALSRALEVGVAPEGLAVDPGFGFGKSPEGNLILLRYLEAFRSLGFPVAAGASRKGFVRRFSGVEDRASNQERLPGSLACLAAAARAGAAIARVHDVAESARFLRMLRAIETPAAGAVRPAGVVR